MESQSKEIVVIEESGFMPVMSIASAVQRYHLMGEFIREVMRDGLDYGAIPGTTGKKVLLKPGAEKLLTLFGLQVSFELVEAIQDWTGQDHDGEPFFYYWYTCTVSRQSQIIASADGSCNSWESKYRYRQANRKCPACGAEAIIKGKAEFGGGWLCWKKRGGCGAKFKDNDEGIVNQTVGRTLNKDVADQVNTIQKMAQKRALVAPVLIATNASDWFTQDMEDFGQVSNDTKRSSQKAPWYEDETNIDQILAQANKYLKLTPAKVREIIGNDWTRFASGLEAYKFIKARVAKDESSPVDVVNGEVAAAPAERQKQSETHWITEHAKWFWGWIDKVGLTQDVAREEFGVKSMRDFAGSREDAQLLLNILNTGIQDKALGLQQMKEALGVQYICEWLERSEPTFQDATKLLDTWIARHAKVEEIPLNNEEAESAAVDKALDADADFPY